LSIAIALQFTKHSGSEFDVVIMCIPKAAPMLLTRNLLYTGITRAKELLIVVGDSRTIGFMIQNVDSKKRNTGLDYKLRLM
jgi:exodeoxyribonuclease V alpha subunit